MQVFYQFNPAYWIRNIILIKKFKKNIKQISIEFSSLCNRKCNYCPHSLIDRENANLSDDTLEKILYELSSIKFDKWICLNIYNEPLMDIERLLFVLCKIKEKLPLASISFSTNGDYLTKEIFRELQQFGLSRIDVTIHQKMEKTWDEENAKKTISSFLNKLGWEVRDITGNNGFLVCNFDINNTEVHVFARNFIVNGVNRAGVLNSVNSATGYKRNRPCFRPKYDLSISYDGSIYPCCQFFHGLKETQPYIIGNVNTQNIIDIYFSKPFIIFRKMASTTYDKHPCDTCSE
jgi:radical SAM protein with 4Fe4S-binding SPASM domain